MDSFQTILGKIATGGEVLWSNAAKAIEDDAAAIAKFLGNDPIAQQALKDSVSAVKQGASDLLGIGGTMLGQAAPLIVKGAETAADAALTKLIGPAEVAASPLVHNVIDGIVEAGIAALQAWGLKAKAQLAAPAPVTLTVATGTSQVAPAPAFGIGVTS